MPNSTVLPSKNEKNATIFRVEGLPLHWLHTAGNRFFSEKRRTSLGLTFAGRGACYSKLENGEQKTVGKGIRLFEIRFLP